MGPSLLYNYSTRCVRKSWRDLMMSQVIYMPLHDEGTNCWRPVNAHHISSDIYKIVDDVEPEGENWIFSPGSRVRCREHAFADGKVGLVAFEFVR